MKSNRWTAIFAITIVCGVIAGITHQASGLGAAFAQIQEPQVEGDSSHSYARAHELSDAFRQVSKQALPAVVSIKTTGKVVRRTSGRSRIPNDQFFKDLFGNDPRLRGLLDGNGGAEREFRTPSGHGSGFIIDGQGIVLTNAHVVDGAEEVVVRLADGREFTATDVKADQKADVAVLKIDVDEQLPSLKMGNDEQMEIGDWVLAFGSPFGMHRSVTQGIISAKGRGLDGDGKEFLQTDAAINPGNSGGPLLNLRGEVIGINTAISTRSGGYDGVSFAIPVGHVRWVAEQLQSSGHVQRAYVGIQMQEIDSSLAKNLNLSVPRGVAVTQVVPDSPADKAGFETGDVILEVNRRRVSNPLNMMGVVERLTVGNSYEIRVLRDGRERDLQITVAQRPDLAELQRQDSGSHSDDESSIRLGSIGLSAQDLTPDIAAELGMPSDSGVVITEVDPRSQAARMGLSPGMVIASVANRPVNSTEELQKAIELSQKQGRLLLLVKRSVGNSSISKFISIPLRG